MKMKMYLVLPGDYKQFNIWMADYYCKHISTYVPVPIIESADLRGIDPTQVDHFEQIGTYWTNPAWGSSTYNDFMAWGMDLGKSWAMTWETDWAQAQWRMEPITPQKVMTVRKKLLEMEERLNEMG